jgi:hypothetical protein
MKAIHIALKYHMPRDLASKDVAHMIYVPTADKFTNILTMLVPSTIPLRMVDMLMNFSRETIPSLLIQSMELYTTVAGGFWNMK